MSTPSVLEYAELSLRVYNRSDENRFPVPVGWQELLWDSDNVITGFSAGVYKSGNDIVISFTGTNEASVADFNFGNIPAALGLPSSQVSSAILLYEAFRNAYPTAQIGQAQFDGHHETTS